MLQGTSVAAANMALLGGEATQYSQSLDSFATSIMATAASNCERWWCWVLRLRQRW